MKKSKLLILVICLLMVSIFVLTACSNADKEVNAFAIEGADIEEFAFAVSKKATNRSVVIAAMNEVIVELGTDKLGKQLQYHFMVEGGAKTEIDGSPLVKGFEIPTNTDFSGGKMVVYTNATFPPYEYKMNNKVVGLDMDIMQLVANKLKMSLTIVDITFDSIFVQVDDVKSNETRVAAAGITRNKSREETFDFSNTYFKSVQYIVSVKGDDYKTLDALKGKKVGVQTGTTGDFLVESTLNESKKLKKFDSAALAFEALKKGRVSAVVIDEYPAKKLVANANATLAK